MRKLSLLWIPAFLFLLVLSTLLLRGKHSGGEGLTVLYVNNLRGVVMPIAAVTSTRGVRHASLPEICAWVSRARTKRRGVLFLSGGNSLLGEDGTSNYFRGKPAADLFDSAGLDAFVPGESELCLGPGLKELAKNHRVPFVLTNLKREAGSVFRESSVLNVGTRRVAVFGWFEPRPAFSKGGARAIFPGYSFYYDPAFLRSTVAGTEADIKILLAFANDYDALARTVPELDLVIPLRFSRDLPGLGLRRIGRTQLAGWVDSRHFLGEVKLDGGTKSEGVSHLLGPYDSRFPSWVDKALEPFVRDLDRIFRGRFGRLDEQFLALGARGLTHDLFFFRATPAGCLTAELVREAAGADLALVNHLAMRESLEGLLGFPDLARIYPFLNRVVTMKLSGAALKALLDRNALENRRYLQSGGVFESYRPGDPSSCRIWVGASMLDAGSRYLVATIDYLAQGARGKEPLFLKGEDVSQTRLFVPDIVFDACRPAPFFPPPPQSALRLEDSKDMPKPSSEAQTRGDAGVAAQGAFFESRGQWEKAEEAYKAAVSRDPRSAPSRLGLGRIYWRLGVFGESRRQLLAAVEADPSCGEAHFYLGLDLLKSFNYFDSARQFEEALRSEPERFEYMVLLGFAQYMAGRPVEALEVLSRAAEKRQDRKLRQLVEALRT
jgi:2',3'-cyclic-nucleotide 2'-phosphodiesterase (5'-nucleotidase family)